ncbi:sister chromatid cohesion 1 protein 3-like [Panicum miliaceum]|uniref:Sister chromatid cohesion 1 protein 3-like n=1 Tax=Panicum miliaceum TaxID=4540 RepID=A0A3L6RHK5_PANMI|nr:sister chromatid cohesion 1 protein 3-like [Panicum miliaceum]
MFYSHTILARKSPLGTVWIAAHLERKIKKPQIDGIDIPSYAESIMFPEVPVALRLSGHLLLGLVRIYSWKVNYLFQDCNRMVTTVRTAFASVQVDLPVDADRAPFESITLPPTLNLDDLNLDDAICLMETPDSHQKSRDQITLSEGEYVMIELDEDARVEPSAHMGPTPMEDETFPPFDDGFGADNNRNEEIPIHPPPGNLPVDSNVINQTDEALDPPETMRAHESPGLMLTEPILGNDDPMDLNSDPSPFVQNKVITPPVIDETSSAGRQAPERSIANLRTPNTYDAFADDALLNFDTQLPEFRLEPSPPPVQEKDDNRRPKAQVNKRKRKRRVKFDDEIVLSNE